MKRFLWLCAVFCFFALPVFADFTELIGKADRLYNDDQYGEAKKLLLDSVGQAGSNKEKAELYWRLGRATLKLGEAAQKLKEPQAKILKIFEEGEQHAAKAIELDPKNHLGYYWKSSNIGRWGQVKGILNSLFKAGPMRDLLKTALTLRPDHADSYFVLGQLYEQVPGFPVSFGNADFSVSLGRKAMDLNRAQLASGEVKETKYDYANELAKHLYKRNWNAAKRQAEQPSKKSRYESTADILEKNLHYEGVVALKNISDREEARELIQWVIGELGRFSSLKQSQANDLQKAKDIQASW